MNASGVLGLQVFFGNMGLFNVVEQSKAHCNTVISWSLIFKLGWVSARNQHQLGNFLLKFPFSGTSDMLRFDTLPHALKLWFAKPDWPVFWSLTVQSTSICCIGDCMCVQGLELLLRPAIHKHPVPQNQVLNISHTCIHRGCWSWIQIKLFRNLKRYVQQPQQNTQKKIMLK